MRSNTAAAVSTLAAAAPAPLAIADQPQQEDLAAPARQGRSEPAVPALAVTADQAAPVEVRRSQGHVEITTSGSPREVVPALLALLAEGDAELRAAAQEHLQLMNDGLRDDPAIASRLAPVPEVPEARDQHSVAALWNHPAQPPPDPVLWRWQSWWHLNEPVLEEP
ncbi:MAG: hypothetical protein U1E76_05535 [Planctomycetota bacterium]